MPFHNGSQTHIQGCGHFAMDEGTGKNWKDYIWVYAVSGVTDTQWWLIYNTTTNLTETWMQIRCKFDSGKVVNRSHERLFSFQKLWSRIAEKPWENLGHFHVGKNDRLFATWTFYWCSRSFCKSDRERKSTEEAKASWQRKSNLSLYLNVLHFSLYIDLDI